MSEDRYSNLTVKPRELLKKQIDDFATFVWRGVRSFDKYGAFIINNKNSLKFYNGPSFTNEYSKPKFSSTGSNLTGISFSTQTISFQVGAYWLTEAEYREFINWLNPYEISYLGFDFEDKYDYLVKLSKIGDSTRYVVGRNENNEPCYYTELNLTFEVQGEACARARYGYEFDITQKQDDPNTLQAKIKNDIPEYITSDLNFPFVLDASLIATINSSPNIQVTLIEMNADNNKNETTLFSVNFQNLDQISSWTKNNNFIQQDEIKQTYFADSNTAIDQPKDVQVGQIALNIRYDSESSLLFLRVGEQTEQIISLVSYHGKKIIKDFQSFKCKLPGRFSKSSLIEDKYSKYTIEIKIIDATFPTNNNDAVHITAYARTNLI